MTTTEAATRWRAASIGGACRAATEELFAEDARLYVTGIGWITGRQAIIHHLTEAASGFRDVEARNSRWIADEHSAAHRYHMHAATFAGRILELEVFDLYRFRDGKVRVMEQFFDPLDRYRQLFG